MRPRIAQEFTAVKARYPDIVHMEHGGEDWFLLPRYSCPQGWEIDGSPKSTLAIAFRLGAAYPQGEPYGFATAAKITFKGAAPQSAGSSCPCPFEGDWQQFSWAPDDWTPTDDIHDGSNMLAWVRSFVVRLKEGA